MSAAGGDSTPLPSRRSRRSPVRYSDEDDEVAGDHSDDDYFPDCDGVKAVHKAKKISFDYALYEFGTSNSSFCHHKYLNLEKN